MDYFKEAAKEVVEGRRMEDVIRMSDLAKKCEKCFHYSFDERSPELPWHYNIRPFGHVCHMDSVSPNERIELNPVKKEELYEKNKRSANPKDSTDREMIRDYFFGFKTIEDRVESGECEFAEFPEPRSKPWTEEDKEWDKKYKVKYLQILESELKEAGMKESKIQETIGWFWIC